jgi:hypothetical protein
VLDIGGGFRQAFAGDAAAFDEYVQAMKDGLTGRGRPLTWDGNTLGYRFEDGRVQGVPVFHKYANRVTGPESLGQLLDGVPPAHGGRRTAQVLRDNMIELWLEPGKSLVDQAGITLASVEFVKEAADGSLLVNLDLSRDKICPAGQEVMLDPVLIYRSAPRSGLADPHAGPGQRAGLFLGGNLCLERDMIFNHLTFVERLPVPGDIVAFINTAAYQMDLSASGALMQRREGGRREQRQRLRRPRRRRGPGGGGPVLYCDITELIGNTPLLRLDPGKHGIDGAELYAKLEFCNPFGSVKDRIAWGMIRDGLPGITSRGQTLIEASSGNTAKALQRSSSPVTGWSPAFPISGSGAPSCSARPAA